VAREEVEAAWAEHDARLRPCGPKTHQEELRRLDGEAARKAADCIKAQAPPPPPVDTTAAVPVAPNAEIEEALREIPSGIHFALNRNDLSPTSRNVIKRIAAVLVKYPNVRVELEGHTDSRGSAEYNLALSKRRADAVKDGLVAQGVAAGRISASFAGKTGLLNAEKDVTDLALNRRVDFKYFDQGGTPIVARKQTGDIQVENPKKVIRTRKAATRP
jgi:outer membrane protein OmpA-like peptidoglycan-associated protein